MNSSASKLFQFNKNGKTHIFMFGKYRYFSQGITKNTEKIKTAIKCKLVK